MDEYPISGPAAILPNRLSGMAAWPRNRETLWRLGALAERLKPTELSELTGCVRRHANGFVVAAPDQVPGVHDALALDVDVAALLEQERVIEALIDVLRHLNSTLDVRGLHPRRDVDRVAPHVVEELARPDHPGDHGSGRQADPQRHLPALRILQIGDGVGHVQGEAGQRLDVIGRGAAARR